MSPYSMEGWNCFLIAPYADEFEDVNQRTRDVIHRAAEKNVRVTFLQNESKSGNIHEKIQVGIEEADFCVANLTGCNSNVLWEIGYAMACDKGVVLLLDEGATEVEDLPFDLQHQTVYKYRLDSVGAKNAFSPGLQLVVENEVKCLDEKRKRLRKIRRSRRVWVLVGGALFLLMALLALTIAPFWDRNRRENEPVGISNPSAVAELNELRTGLITADREAQRLKLETSNQTALGNSYLEELEALRPANTKLKLAESELRAQVTALETAIAAHDAEMEQLKSSHNAELKNAEIAFQERIREQEEAAAVAQLEVKRLKEEFPGYRYRTFYLLPSCVSQISKDVYRVTPEIRTSPPYVPNKMGKMELQEDIPVSPGDRLKRVVEMRDDKLTGFVFFDGDEP